MNKIVLGLILSLLMLISACGQQEPREIELKPYSLAELAKTDFASVDKITVKSGETGEVKTVTDQETVSAWIDFINTVEFTPDINQEKRAGWSYMIRFYEGKKKIVEFYPNYIDDIYFNVNENVVAKLDELFIEQ